MKHAIAKWLSSIIFPKMRRNNTCDACIRKVPFINFRSGNVTATDLDVRIALPVELTVITQRLGNKQKQQTEIKSNWKSGYTS
jgi:hypothetical protein